MVLFSIPYSKSADFIIISEPSQLSIYNQYEQSVNQSEKERLLPNSPFQIINRNEVLGDQITEALRGFCSGSTFFIVKGTRGTFKGGEQVKTKTFTKCTVLEDMVVLKKPIILREPFSDRSISCKEGSSVIRVFQTGSSFFILKGDSPRQYGWYDGNQTVFKVAQAEKKAESGGIADIESTIQNRLTLVNKVYNDYFNYFNSITQQQKTVPQWKLSRNGQILKCTFVTSNQITGQMEQSSQYIVQEIEQLLLGKPFSVDYHTGEITIKPR